MLRLPDFEFIEPATVDEAVDAWRNAGGDVEYVSGGTDLYPNMKRRQQEPKTVISLMGVEGIDGIVSRTAGQPDGLTIGAGTTLTEIAGHEQIRDAYPAVARAASLISTPQLRNMGTIGGNLCLDTRCNYYDQTYEWRCSVDFCMKKDGEICWVAPSSPRCWAVNSSDLAPVMVAIGAEFVLVGPEGARTLPAAGFYVDDGIDYLTQKPGEILTEIRLPATGNWDATYHKLRRRGSFDFPVLGVAAWIAWDGNTVSDARIVLGAVASYPQEIPEAAAAIRGSALDDPAVAAAAQAAFKSSKPMDNTDYGLAWRKQMTRVYVTRALEELRERRESISR
ncbi:MAG: FAD binding domain-containing protein [Gemmatimonadales bacterium]